MKKKLLSTLLCITCVLSLTACNEKDETVAANEERQRDLSAITKEFPGRETDTETDAEEENQTEVNEESTENADATSKNTSTVSTNAPTELSDDLYSFQVSINGTVYQFPMWYSDFEALGFEFCKEPTDTLSSYQYTVAEEWIKDKVSVYTTIANLSANTATYDKCIVGGIEFSKYYLEDSNWEIILPKGIQYGVSTTEDIIAAYGTPTSDYDGDLYYKMTYELDYHESIDLYVYKDSGVLEEIDIEHLIELEGADNSINSEVPDVVKEYKAPTSVGNDFYSFNCELEGAYYTLPCPVSELLENGFVINKDNSAESIAAGSYDWVELRYNNQSFRAIARNYADYATTIENCFLTSIEAHNYGPTYNLVIPGGITLGSSEEDVLAAIKDYNYDFYEGSSSNTYTIYDPKGSSLDNYEIITRDGVVSGIEVNNSK